ncbi:MAG: glutathione-disulfide reductase [Alphaproteobacteria bacterium]|nr:glutathione-disulfide reductase [Alphaproteobacteria bacterium]
MDYDLFVIGAGSGGVRAARIAGGHGAKVALAEESRVGGTCVMRGCVPKKFLVYAAHFAEDFEDARGYGWTVGKSKHSWKKLIRNKNAELDRLEAAYGGMLDRAHVALMRGRARVTGPHEVEIGGKRVAARNILVSTGSRPFIPEIPGREYAITSNEALDLPKLPRRIAIVGGGYIAVEFAGIFNGLGAEVILVYRGEMILRGFDHDARAHLQAEMQKKGIDIRLGREPVAIEKKGRKLVVRFHDDTGLEDEGVECDTVMYATGRRPNTRGIGLEELGLAMAENGAIKVDQWSRSSVPSIFAVGDATDRINLTPVALMEGHAFADTVFGNLKRPVDHESVPMAVFSQPPVGSAGLSEERAREKGFRVDIYRTTFKAMKHTISGRDERTMMKLVVDRASDRVLGAHMVGQDAPEIIQGIAIAVKAGLTKAAFDRTIGIHPTAAEEFVTLRQKVPDVEAEAAE